jgi:prepilin-type N-terminal cleavage/methylation domain-containing protein
MKAFTLIEILVVVTIIGFMAVLSLGSFNQTNQLLSEQKLLSEIKNEIQLGKNKMLKNKDTCLSINFESTKLELKQQNCKENQEISTKTITLPDTVKIQTENDININFTQPEIAIGEDQQTIRFTKGEKDFGTITILENGIVVEEKD